MVPASDSNSAAEIGDDRETDDLSLINDSGTVSSELTVVSGSVMGLAVSRFRTRQRESEADVRKYSRTARFIRRNS